MGRKVTEDSVELRQFGLRLKEARSETKLTQEQVAEAVDVHFRSMSKYERGLSWPTLGVLLRLAELYGVEVGSLFPKLDLKAIRESGPKYLPPGHLVTADADEAELLRTYRTLPPSLRRSLLGGILGTLERLPG